MYSNTRSMPTPAVIRRDSTSIRTLHVLPMDTGRLYMKSERRLTPSPNRIAVSIKCLSSLQRSVAFSPADRGTCASSISPLTTSHLATACFLEHLELAFFAAGNHTSDWCSWRMRVGSRPEQWNEAPLSSLVEMCSSMTWKPASPAELKTIMHLHREGYTDGEVTALLWAEHRIARGPATFRGAIKRLTSKKK